ncbi:HEAT repeat domain-containing protein [Methanoregula sp.]|jgi:hypothetical protein|uniref:HEAT repeat domain-containing protein n=1 Tax=Methanoregula sp. TaxID=2052170 RepID=UPI003C1848B7
MATKKIQPPQREDFIEADLHDLSDCMKLRGVREVSRSKDLSHFRSLIRVFSEIDRNNRPRSEQLELIREIYKIFVVLGTFALMELTDALSSTDEKIRSAAAQIIGYLGFCQAIPALLQVLDDESPDVRKYAIRAFGVIRYSSDTIEGAVINALNDSDPGVVQEAIIAAGRLELKSSVPHLSVMVERIPETCDLSDIEHDQIFYATRALGFIGDRSATPMLLKVLRELVDDGCHVPNLLTFGVIDALGDLRDPECAKVLVIALWDFQRQAFNITDEDGYEIRRDDYDALTEAVARIHRALYHLEREADEIIIKEFMEWIKDHREGRGSECNSFEIPRPPTGGMRLLGYMSSNPQESFANGLIEVLQARGQPVIDPAMGMLKSPYQEVRIQGVRILAGFAAGNENVVELFRNLYANEDENETVKSVVFSSLLEVEPAKALAMFKTTVAKPRRTLTSGSEIYVINQLGYSTLQQLTGVLTSSRNDATKEKALDIFSVLVNDTNAMVPPVDKKSRRLLRRRRIYHERNYIR